MDCFKACVVNNVNNVPDGIVHIKCLPCFIANISTFLFTSVAAVAVIYALFAGWKFVISRGDVQKVTEARKTLTYALLGLTVVILSYFMIETLSKISGVGCISLLGFDKCN